MWESSIQSRCIEYYLGHLKENVCVPQNVLKLVYNYFYLLYFFEVYLNSMKMNISYAC